jgi:SAM-dependent methyltransferase
MLEKFTKFPILRNIGRWIRRSWIKNKMVYFISNSPVPLSNYYGIDRGIPLDRFYIEDFLENNKAFIRGICLEIQDRVYTERFGKDGIVASHVLDFDKKNDKADIFADLRKIPEVKDNTYDCIILTQVLQFIDEPNSVISECFRILKPGGIVLATLPTVSRIDLTAGIENDFWRFTKAGAKTLFGKVPFSETIVESRGNCRAGLYFLAGVAWEETSKGVLETEDESFPVIVTVRARK